MFGNTSPILGEVTIVENYPNPQNPTIAVKEEYRQTIYFETEGEVINNTKVYNDWSWQEYGDGNSPNALAHGTAEVVFTTESESPYFIKAAAEPLGSGGGSEKVTPNSLMVNKRLDYSLGKERDENYLTLEFQNVRLDTVPIRFDSSLVSNTISINRNLQALQFDLFCYAHNATNLYLNNTVLFNIELNDGRKSYRLQSVTPSSLFRTVRDTIKIMPLQITLPVLSASTARLEISFPEQKPRITNVVSQIDTTSGYKLNESITKLNNSLHAIPEDFKLNQNYPNPFNPVSNIRFELPEKSDVRLIVYDIHGRVVSELVNDNLPAGYHSAVFNGENLSSGLYIYELTADNYRDIKKMLLVK